FTEATIRQVLRETGFEVIDDGKYCHIVTFEYLLSKLGTLGLPGASALARALESSAVGRVEIPFRFGDIKLYVCRKIADAPARSIRRSTIAPPLDEDDPAALTIE